MLDWARFIAALFVPSFLVFMLAVFIDMLGGYDHTFLAAKPISARSLPARTTDTSSSCWCIPPEG